MSHQSLSLWTPLRLPMLSASSKHVDDGRPLNQKRRLDVSSDHRRRNAF
jgi:hypothetical protein